jgi:hypothetical protein
VVAALGIYHPTIYRKRALYRIPPKFQKGIKILKQSGIFPLSQLYKSEEMYLRHPAFKRGKGPFLYDYDDHRFVDFELSGGSLLLGHAPPRITSSIKSWLGRGFATGYLSAGAKWEKAVFLYYDSAHEAISSFLELLYLIDPGKKALVVLSDADTERTPHTVPLYFRNLRTVDMASFHGLSIENIDFVFLKFGKSAEEKTANNIIKEIRKRRIPIFADAVDFESYIHILRLVNWTEDLDAVVFGKWVASGLSFGSVVIQQAFFNKLFENVEDDNSINGKIDFIASLFGLPAVFKLKAVQKNLSLLRKLGGITAIVRKGDDFFSWLNDAYFYNRCGIVYMKESEHLMNDYDNLRANFMRNGLYFPLLHWEPVAVSNAHSLELLRSCALKINSLLDAFHQ